MSAARSRAGIAAWATSSMKRTRSAIPSEAACWGNASVELEAPPEAAAAALDALIPALAEASGGSCREAVPAAVRALPAALFPRYHAELAAFLREDDIDRKAAQGWLLVETLLAVTSAAPTVPPPAASPA